MATHFLPGKSPGQRILAGYSPWGLRRVRYNLTITQQQQGTNGNGYILENVQWYEKCQGLPDFLIAQSVKNLPAVQETWVQSLGWKDPLEKERATHSSILAWRIPWTEEPAAVHGLQRVGHDRAANTDERCQH